MWIFWGKNLSFRQLRESETETFIAQFGLLWFCPKPAVFPAMGEKDSLYFMGKGFPCFHEELWWFSVDL